MSVKINIQKLKEEILKPLKELGQSLKESIKNSDAINSLEKNLKPLEIEISNKAKQVEIYYKENVEPVINEFIILITDIEDKINPDNKCNIPGGCDEAEDEL
jgi:hypothetical protein